MNEIRHNPETNEYLLCVGGAGNPILRSKDRGILEKWKKFLELKEQELKKGNTRHDYLGHRNGAATY